MVIQSTSITEQALRAAVTQVTGLGTVGEGELAAKISETAKEKAHSLVLPQTNSETSATQLDLQGAAIDLAIKGLVIAAMAIHEQVKVMREKRLGFDKERQAGIASFTVRVNEEYTKLSLEERLISEYVHQIQKRDYSTYFGINSQVLTEDNKLEFHSVLPYYKMSEHLRQPVASTNMLDQKRVIISLFFKSALPGNIADLDHDFTSDSAIKAFFESSWQGKNYLNDLRAPRFIMMSLANLLWHLQDPINKHGEPLSIPKRIELCKDVLLFLNSMLNHRSTPFIHNLDMSDILQSFVQRVELHVKGLRDAFIHERMNAINIEEVTSSTHHSLRIMDKCVFKLIYRYEKPGEEGSTFPNPRAAQQLASTIGYMDELLDIYPKLISHFTGVFTGDAKQACLNSPPRTLIDALIIFLHATRPEKDIIIKRLNSTKLDSGQQMAAVLKELDQTFIKPIKDKIKSDGSLWRKTSKNREAVARVVAQRLLPLITLVLEDFRIDVSSMAGGCDSQLNIMCGDTQLKKINRDAETGEGYYQWKISPFIQAAGEFADSIDELPQKQFRLTKISELLDNLKSLIFQYRSFLAYPQFQKFLLACIKDVEKEFESLGDFVEELDMNLTHDEFISREIKAILVPMTASLTETIKEFEESAKFFSKRISAPSFPGEQKRILQQKVKELSEQYRELFDKDANIDDIIEIPDVEQAEFNMVPRPRKIAAVPVVSNKVVAHLSRLITDCEQSMSQYVFSQHKRMLMKELLNDIQTKENITHSDVRVIVKELAKIVMAYRASPFFQASYGETKSAKFFCQRVIRYKDDESFPLAEYLFGDQVEEYDLGSSHSILSGLKALATENRWEKNASQLVVSSYIMMTF